MSTTFYNTFSSLVNVGFLMLLIIYVYAVIGVHMFAPVKLNGPMNDRLNFQTVGNAFVALIRVATGEGWNDLMEALGRNFNEFN
jgi:hypothetical protein